METLDLLILLLLEQQVLVILTILYNMNFGRRMWVRQIFQERDELGEFNLVQQMQNDPESFHKYFRMNVATFFELLHMVEPHIAKQDTHWRKAIPPAQRLAITLRYLATGDSQSTISLSFRVGQSTVGEIILETCNAIWNVLMPKYLKSPSSAHEWKKIAKEFERLWNFPMCLGAIDGKHVVIQAPKKAGSEYFNYKGTHSIVLMAVCDAQYCFTMVDIGDSGRHSDGGVFANSAFGRKFVNSELNMPDFDLLPNTNVSVPYCIVGDAAFPLRRNLMRPYPGRQLPVDKSIFNYRLSRARRVIENSFGILATRWRIFRRPIIAEPPKAVAITKAACCLHNFLQLRSKQQHDQSYYGPSTIDREDRMGNVTVGEWRGEIQQYSNFHSLGRIGTNMYARDAAAIRDKFKEYFVSDNGKLPWQNAVVNRM